MGISRRREDEKVCERTGENEGEREDETVGGRGVREGEKIRFDGIVPASECEGMVVG